VEGPLRDVVARLTRSGLDWLEHVAVTASGSSVSARLSLESALVERLVACRIAGGCGSGAAPSGTAPADVLRSAPP
jgi:hypothetical protein